MSELMLLISQIIMVNELLGWDWDFGNMYNVSCGLVKVGLFHRFSTV